jgi:hypothetical protein
LNSAADANTSPALIPVPDRDLYCCDWSFDAACSELVEGLRKPAALQHPTAGEVK